VEQELLTLPEQQILHSVDRPLVFCGVFCISLFLLLPFLCRKDKGTREDINGVVRSRKSKEDTQCNGETIKGQEM
jgi:hypothetical protein